MSDERGVKGEERDTAVAGVRAGGHRSPVTSHTISPAEIEHWLAASAAELMPEAARLRDDGHGRLVSFSRKVFIPLTRLCRDVCGYCTFAVTPRVGARAYLTP